MASESTSRSSASFMAGVPELAILQLLSQQELYGYELVRQIRTVSRDALTLAEGVVYPTLHSLESRGLLKSRERVVEGRSRVYYRITRKGSKRLATMHGEWQRVSRGINSILGGALEPAAAV